MRTACGDFDRIRAAQPIPAGFRLSVAQPQVSPELVERARLLARRSREGTGADGAVDDVLDLALAAGLSLLEELYEPGSATEFGDQRSQRAC